MHFFCKLNTKALSLGGRPPIMCVSHRKTDNIDAAQIQARETEAFLLFFHSLEKNCRFIEDV